jgi:deoxyadenosine/deoxycytidine kinase
MSPFPVVPGNCRYAFPLQVYLLNRRFAQQQQIVWQ